MSDNAITHDARVQVVGFGAAALGVPLAADRRTQLSMLLEAGIVFIDAHPSLEAIARNRFPFHIESNSPGQDFLHAISPRHAFADVLSSAAAVSIRRHSHGPVPLRDVGALLNELSRSIVAKCSQHTRSGVLVGRDVATIQVTGDGRFISHDRWRRPIARSSRLVLATGGLETPSDESDLAPYRQRGIPASDVLSGRADVHETLLGGRRPLVIVGSAHSAFACALYLLRMYPSSFDRGGIEIWCREVHLHYRSPAEAKREGYAHGLEAVCTSSQEVHRFSGLRGTAKGLYQRATRGEEGRVRLCRADPHALCRRLAGTDVFVLAAGFRTRTIPIYAPSGREIVLARSGNFVRVDERCRLLDANGKVVPGALGLGLGYARARGVDRYVGVNFFHGSDADAVLEQVLAPCTQGAIREVVAQSEEGTP